MQMHVDVCKCMSMVMLIYVFVCNCMLVMQVYIYVNLRKYIFSKTFQIIISQPHGNYKKPRISVGDGLGTIYEIVINQKIYCW